MAAQVAARYIKNAIVVFIFMTDGGASLPNAGIQALKQLQRDNPNRLKYAGIEFGCSNQVMTIIKNELKGTTGTAYKPEELTELFKKSIEVINHQEK